MEIRNEVPWLLFKICGKIYTVNSRFITSIVIKPADITCVPSVSKNIAGLIHLRGKVVPLIDLKFLLNIKSETEVSKETKEMVVVLEKDNLIMGLLVDEVLSVEDISSYEETDEIKKMYENGYVTGLAKGQKSDDVLLVLDEEKIMNNA